jgi:hypothetical protein
MTAGLLAAGALVFAGLVVTTPPGADVSVVVAYREPRRAPEARHAYDIAYQRGHREGLRAGARDAHRSRRYDPRRHASFREGDRGYRHGLGPPVAYASGYRRGFERGYHRSYVGAAGFHPPHDGYCDQDRRARRW